MTGAFFILLAGCGKAAPSPTTPVAEASVRQVPEDVLRFAIGEPTAFDGVTVELMGLTAETSTTEPGGPESVYVEAAFTLLEDGQPPKTTSAWWNADPHGEPGIAWGREVRVVVHRVVGEEALVQVQRAGEPLKGEAVQHTIPKDRTIEIGRGVRIGIGNYGYLEDHGTHLVEVQIRAPGMAEADSIGMTLRKAPEFFTWRDKHFEVTDTHYGVSIGVAERTLGFVTLAPK